MEMELSDKRSRSASLVRQQQQHPVTGRDACAGRQPALADATARRSTSSAPGSPHEGRRRLAPSRPRRVKRPDLLRSRRGHRNGDQHESYDKLLALVHTPLYTLARHQHSVQMDIWTDAFFSTQHETEVAGKVAGVSPKSQNNQTHSSHKVLEDSIKAQDELQREVSEMGEQLELERLRAQQHLEEVERKFLAEKEAMVSQCEAEIKKVVEEKAGERKSSEARLTEEFEAVRESLEARILKLSGEVEFANEEMKRTKSYLLQEFAENLREKEQELEKQYLEQMKTVEDLCSKRAAESLGRSKEELGKKHCREVDALKDSHAAELKRLLSQFTDAAKLEEDLAKAQSHVSKLQLEAKQLRLDLKSTRTNQLQAEASLTLTKKQLNNLEKHLESKVHQVELRYQSRIDALLLERNDLRRSMLQQVEDSASYRGRVESARLQSRHSLRDRVKMLVGACSKADLGVAIGLSANEHGHTPRAERRPLSAPITSRETGTAQESARHSFRMEREQLNRPQTSLPSRHHRSHAPL